MKAFYSVHWETLFRILHAMGMPSLMVDWIKACLTSAHFSISINGGLTVFCSLSVVYDKAILYRLSSFVIVMEFLHWIASRGAAAGYLPFHSQCRKLEITHLCFADDLLIFISRFEFGV